MDSLTKRSVSRNITAGESSEREANVVLEFADGWTVEGQVQRNGRPVAGALVAIAGGADGGDQMQASTRTSNDGEFLFEDVSTGQYLLTALDMGAAKTRRIDVDSDTFIDVQLGGAAVAGRVVDRETGAPIAGASVQALGVATGEFRVSVSDSHGQFAIPEVDSGAYQLATSAPGFGTATDEVIVGQEAEELTIELTRVSPLRLRVTEAESGRPLRSALITVRDARLITAFRGVVLLENDGSGSCAPVDSGTYTLQVEAEGYQSAVVEVIDSSAVVWVRLQRLAP
jgi:hypothetical protein